MSIQKRWRDRLASHPHLPTVKEIPLPMRKRHGEDALAHRVRGEHHFVEDFAAKPARTR